MTAAGSVPEAVHDHAGRPLGFASGSTVEVRQVGDQEWATLRTLTYRAKVEDFEVPVAERTDFASVPRPLVWFIPRYGRYTPAAILHDHLCSTVVRAGSLSRLDADGIFRQAMRELGVPFLRRWIMWAAVRWGALTTREGRANWWREAGRVVLVSAVALPVVLPAAAVIVVTLPVFYLLEVVVWVPLWAAQQVRKRRSRTAKAVNRPALHWKL